MAKLMLTYYGLGLLLCGTLLSCGTGIGNPAYSSPTENDFTAVLGSFDDAPDLLNCGSFNLNSSLEQLQTGRACFYQAFLDCTPAKYLVDFATSASQRFSAYVELSPLDEACEIFIRFASTDDHYFLGAGEKTCQNLGINEIPELACNIANGP